MNFGRRTFLQCLATAVSVLGFDRGGGGAELLAKEAGGKADPGTAGNPFESGGKSLVAAVGGKNLPGMVRKAVSLIGGFGPLALRGKSVLVKANVVGAYGNPTTTNPSVVAAVVGTLYEAGAGKVYVGDMSALIRGKTADNMARTGILAAARGAGAEPLFFEDHEWVKVKVGGRYLKEVPVTEW